MKVVEYDTARQIEYFDLFDFVSKIKLTPRTLEHMEETSQQFDDYFQKLSKYNNDNFLLYFWTTLAYDEIRNNQFVENHNIKDFDINIANLFFDSLNINHNRIHNIHKFVLKDIEDNGKIGVYRKNPVRVSRINDDVEEIFWYGVKPEDIKKFMSTFIELYKTKSPSVLNSSPFLKSSLMHLLLVKIQPYYDGNRRTARALHNIKFTESLNKIYGMNLKISPVNLSETIMLYPYNYAKFFTDTSFDLDHDNNEVINSWFNFMLNRYDDQLFRMQNMIDNMDSVMDKIHTFKTRMDKETIEKIDKMHVRIKTVPSSK